MQDSHKPRRVLRGPALAGSLLALLFWWQSLTPTLVPRSWATQTVIGAICLAAGYGTGALVGYALHRYLDRWGRVPGSAIRRRGSIVLAAVWLVAIIVGSRLWLGWQSEQRRFMDMAPIGSLDATLVGVLSPFAGVLVVMLGRMVALGIAAGKRAIQRRVPSIVSMPATALVIVGIIVVIGIALGRATALPVLRAAAHFVHAPANERTAEGIVAPESPAVSGSSASLVPWETLGRMGRTFVATATSKRELAKFHGTDTGLVEPVRIYVGLRSADSAVQRARLAVRELERAGGFDRKVLVVWVTTGTGWIVPKAAASLEQLYGGDTAIVAIQYSFLPSVLANFMEARLANEAAIALFDAVRERWSTLPADRRPRLFLFGKSLGAAGVEAVFAGADAASSVANMVARTDGALIVGGKQGNPVHSQLTRGRDRGSPFWQPVFDGGRTVRFLNRDPHQVALDAAWPAPRIVYLQHAGDPAVFWNARALWWPPEWLTPPRGFDVPQAMHWFPIVTSVQAMGDLLNMLAGVPPGFGHNYSSQEYVKGWASVMPPEGWTDADTERLARFIDEVPGDETEP
jgi:uncharacterized membrane protein